MPALDGPVVTDRLVLRPFRRDDADALYGLRTRPEVLRYLYWPPATRAEIDDIIGQRLTMTCLDTDGDFLVLAVEQAGRLVGEADLALVSAADRHGEIGVILHPDAQGHGYAREVATALLDLAFGPFGMHRVTAQTNAGNTASTRAMLRLGLRQEGHLRECVRFGGAWHDELIFAVLADEWAARPR